MRLKAIVLGSALAVAGALPLALNGQAQEGVSNAPTVTSIYVMNFEVIDLNSDKLVDRAEFEQLHNDMFYMMDGDKSGGLSMREINGVTPVQFKLVDADRNGAVSLEEYIQARTIDFEIADQSDDQMLSLEEVRDWAGEEDEQ